MHIGQERVVDLHIKAGVDDGLVFLVQRLGERGQIGFFVLVMLDLGARQCARGRYDRQEGGQARMLVLGLGDAGLEILDVAQNLLVRILNRAVDHDSIAEPFA